MAGRDDEREVEQLLPWYVNGTLTGEERERVRRYLQENEHAAVDVEVLHCVRDAVKSDDFGSPGEFGLRRLKEAIHDEARPEAAAAGPGRWWRPAAAAAVLVIIVQGALLIDAWQRGDTWEPAGVEPERPTLQLRFDPAATEKDIRGLLNELDVEIVQGPSSAGVYRAAPVRADADIEELAARLRDAGQVVSHAEVE